MRFSAFRRAILCSLLAALATHVIAGNPVVRRYEWVITVRAQAKASDAIGRAELAAGRAGGAVLENVRIDARRRYSDHRLLVRTADRESIGPILTGMRATQGVIGATAMALPPTETWQGSPSFIESYTAPEDGPPSNAGRVLMRHDIAPVADKRELVESADVVTGSVLPPLESLGGVLPGLLNLNIGGVVRKLHASHWRRREERLRRTPLMILGSDGSMGLAGE